MAQTLMTFETRAEPASIAGVPVDANITGGTLSRGAGVTLNAGGTYNSASWQEGTDLASAIANNNYYSFTVDAASGAQATISEIVIRYDRSGTGPAQLAILSNVTGFTGASTPVFTDVDVNANGENNTILVSGHADLSGTTEFRIYCWGATAATGTFDVEVIDATNAPGVGIRVNGTTTGGGGPTGACCAPAGTCTTTSMAACTGAFQGNGTTCSPNLCPVPTGACCVAGICVGDLSETNCMSSAAGAVWGGAGTSCGSFTCPEATGACCTGATCTAPVAQSACSGTFTVNGTCTPNLCDDGACCDPSTGACRVTFTEADCTLVNGAFTLGGTCTPNPCAQVMGACCVASSCSMQFGTDCRAQSGAFLGVGTICTATTCNRATGANLIAKYDFDVNVLGGGSRNMTFVTSVNPPFPTGDQFGVTQRFVDQNLPFALLDDTLFSFPTDAVGIISEDKVDSWLGSVDLFDIILPTTSDVAAATWTFDISGFSNLSLSIDAAAMGDFESTNGCSQPPCSDDRFIITVSIDGGAPQTLFTAIADEAQMANYTMASGAVITLNDPLVVNGSLVLSNVFQALTAPIAGTGSTLTVTLTAFSDGADEAFAFDNLMIMGDGGVVQDGACCLNGGGCTVTSSVNCGLANGTFQGAGTTCPAPACNVPQTGACCEGATCSVRDQAACPGGAGTNQSFAGVNTVCNSFPATTSPCCLADFNHVGGITVQDIFDFLNAYFGNAPTANINGGTLSVQDIFDFLNAYFGGGC